MEHISRGILPAMDAALLVSDCSRRGVQAAGRIKNLMAELNFKPKQTLLIINRAPGSELDPGTMEEVRRQGLTLAGVIPQDENVYRYDCDGKPIVELPEDSPVRAAFERVLRSIDL